jgi:hypothetical protein
VSREPPSRETRDDEETTGAEPLAVWALMALVVVCVTATYARIPVSELYHVSRGGLAGGLSRALVLINFPIALVAIALALLAADRLGGTVAGGFASLSILPSAFVAWPGVVDQADMDAKALNAVPALGVALALALGVWTVRRGAPVFSARLPLDPARVVVAIGLVIAGLPWLLAEAGFSISDVPALGRIFLGEQIRGAGGGETLQVVHLGHHHGADGLYLALSALLLSRMLPRSGRLRGLVSAYLALMLAYGLANFVQDFWTEQIVKRGWTGRAIPSLLHPSLSVGWAVVLVVAVVVEACAFRPERRRVFGPRPRG